jgi:ribosomal protein S18 acetylase RimI-like enzyme
MNVDPLLDPVRNALDSVHAHFTVGQAPARRYPSDVAPFAVIDDMSEPTLSLLEALLPPGEQVYILNEPPKKLNGLSLGPPLHTLQMLAPEDPQLEIAENEAQPVLMTSGDAGEMFDLITLAFPGFFRSRTYQMSTYYGIRVEGKLGALAGERLCMTGYRENSGVCTHPAHTGRGYARTLMTRLMQDHAAAGVKSFLHVGKANAHAIAIYERMRFRVLRSVALWPISRRVDPSTGRALPLQRLRNRLPPIC